MLLSEIFSKLNIDKAYDFEIDNIATNSKLSNNKSLFVAINGTTVNSHDEKYLMEAYNNGTRAFILEEDVDFLPKNCVSFIVDSSRKTLGLVASRFYDHPSKKLRIIGVTGTKGKTSVSFIIKELIEKYGHSCGVVGTSGAYYGDKHIDTNNTTPDPVTLQSILKDALDSGMEYMVLEVSSQAMKQFRVMGTNFMIAIFTNISPDHIGPFEHADFEEYRHWKRNFLRLGKKVIINKDDENAQYMIESIKKPVITVGRKDADFTIADEDEHGFSFFGKRINTNLHGSFNRMNLALSIAALNEIGFSLNDLIKSTDDITIPGRMEVIEYDNRKIIIDYAHNKLSLESILKELNSWKHNKIKLLIGSVGERTFERRHEIVEVANEFVDEIYLTSDNPNHEDPNKIIYEMAMHSKITTHKISDRALAVKNMIENSSDGDILLIAGKGDERYQLINGEHVHYSDKEEVLRNI